jgi:hypothetical protein
VFGFVTPVGKDASDPFTDVGTVDSFWRTLPREDPIAAKKAVCEALAESVARGSLNVDRLRALLVFDQRAWALIDALLVGDLTEKDQPPSNETRSWQAAFELCRSFGNVHGQFLRSIRDGRRSQGCREYQSYVLLRLFQHRQVELFLRPFSDERSTRFSWKQIHEAYRFAQFRELLHQDLPINRNNSPSVVETTLEREYLHVLVQDMMNGGNFPPRDALWVSRRIPRWCEALTLESQEVRSGERRFIVDPHGDAGLERSTGESARMCLCLDVSPVLNSIRDEIASLRDAPGRPSHGSSPGRGRQLRVLHKLNVLCAPEPAVIARRGERRPTALTVEVAVGMSQILRDLRNKPDDAVAAARPLAATSEDVTTAGFGGSTADSTGADPNGPDTVTQSAIDAARPPHARLKMVDRSDSGCRLYGPTLVTNPPVPGVLIAFREGTSSPWTLGVVRRVKKRLTGKRIEIGVEYIGKDPRLVVVATESDTKSAKNAYTERPRFPAFYLPESAEHPVLPIKTLILPARGLSPGNRLSIRSRTSVHTIQLKEPLEEQADFVWSPFEILDYRRRGEQAPSEAMSEAQ